MAAKLSKANTVLLNEVIEELNGNPFAEVCLDDDRYAPLSKLGLVEFNTDIEDEDHNIGTRLTNKGRTYMTTETQTIEAVSPAVESETQVAEAPVETPKAKHAYPSADQIAIATIEIPVPANTVRQGSRATYPFHMLEIGQSFAVVDDGDKKRYRNLRNAAKSQNTRNEKAGEPARFVVREVADCGQWDANFAGKSGAAAWRVE